MTHRRSEELNLSLTGSQISAISSRPNSGRPNSAQSKRANSMVDIQQSKSTSAKRESAHSGNGDTTKKGSTKGKTPPTSHRSTASSPAAVQSGAQRNGAIPKTRTNEEDFMAFFESSAQPKIRQPSSSSNSAALKKKPSANAVKVLWANQTSKPKMKKPAWAKPSTEEAMSSRSDEPHSIFPQSSARSSDDGVNSDVEIMEEIENSLSHSINKLQSLQNQLSGVNKQENGDHNLTLNSYRSESSAATLTPHNDTPGSPRGTTSIDEFIDNIIDSAPGIETPRTAENAHVSARTSHSDRHRGNAISDNVVANNISRPGQKQKSKASLSSMENSYQNIKPKTPVNQVKDLNPTGSLYNGPHHAVASKHYPYQTNALPSRDKSMQPSVNSSSDKSRKSAGQNVVEDYVKTLNTAASKIQKWYRRHHIRRVAEQAAVRRLLSQKKQEHETRLAHEMSQSVTAADMEERKLEERRRIREEKAKEARQQAIKDLQRKREDRKNEVKKVAEEEISFLQASGKITKSPSLSSVTSKKKLSTRNEKCSGEKANVKNSQRSPVSPLPSTERYEQPAARADSAVAPSDGEREEGDAVGGTDKATEANTRTTLDDLYNTLKKLEEEENLTTRSEKKASWLDELEKAQEEEIGSNLTAENLEKLNSSKDALSKSGFLSDGKLKSIIDFLDEVQVTDRLSEIDTEISRMNEELEKPALLLPSATEISQIEQAQATASEVTNTMLSQRLQLDEKKRTVSMLQKALNQQRELTVRHARETEKEMKKRLDVQKDEYEEAIKRHLSFIDQLIDDKRNLGEKCEKLVTELKTVDKKYQDKMKSSEESHLVEITKLKEVHSAAERLRREKWIEDKTKKIKEMTVKGLEPEIQRLIGKHKSDVKKIKQIHEAELLEADERAAQKYVKMTEELRDQLAEEKDAACAREREASKKRYEKQLQQEEEAYQQQRRRLYQEVQEEKDRVASSSSRQRAELEKLQSQLEESHRHALQSMKEEFNTSRDQQEKRHKAEIRELQEKLKLEKESWEENYMKRHDTWLVQKERELKDQIKKERDKEIELVIERLEEDASTVREENERTTEQKIRRLREKFETETRELEQSERKAVHKHNEIKAKMTEVEGENERLKVIVRQKEQEILDNKKLLEKMHSERSHVSDIIRQEFADRIVATDEENKRTKHEISELRARHRIELERSHEQMEELRKTKDEEMEEVHKRVKQAIVKKEEVVSQLKQQYQAATKRADHLEGLLEQQRKQLLSKK